MDKQNSYKYDNRLRIFKVGATIKIHWDGECAKNFFKQFGLQWKQEHNSYLGTSAKVKQVGMNGNLVLKMHNGKDLVLYSLEEDNLSLVRRRFSSPPIKILEKNIMIPPVIRANSDSMRKVKTWKVVDLVNGKLSNQIHQQPVEIEQKNDGRRESISLNSNPSDDDDGDLNVSAEFRKFLLWVKLQQYHATFLAEGFDCVDDLRYAELADFQAIGLKRGHAMRLIRGLEGWITNNSPGGEPTSPEESESPRTKKLNTSKGSSLNIIPEYHLSQGDLWDDDSMNSSEPFSWANPQGHSRNQSKWENEGCLIIPFEKRPLGFGIMSPLYIGTMVATISDESLKEKGLGLGLPILCINNFDVIGHNLKSVSSILSLVSLPFTITFGLEPYFKVGQKVMVFRNHKWHPATVKKMSKRTRKVTINYDNNPFRFANTEKILNYNRIKSPSRFEDAAQSKAEPLTSEQKMEEQKTELNLEDSKDIRSQGRRKSEASTLESDRIKKPTSNISCKVINQERPDTKKVERIKIVRKSRISARKIGLN